MCLSKLWIRVAAEPPFPVTGGALTRSALWNGAILIPGPIPGGIPTDIQNPHRQNPHRPASMHRREGAPLPSLSVCAETPGKLQYRQEAVIWKSNGF